MNGSHWMALISIEIQTCMLALVKDSWHLIARFSATQKTFREYSNLICLNLPHSSCHSKIYLTNLLSCSSFLLSDQLSASEMGSMWQYAAASADPIDSTDCIVFFLADLQRGSPSLFVCVQLRVTDTTVYWILYFILHCPVFHAVPSVICSWRRICFGGTLERK